MFAQSTDDISPHPSIRHDNLTDKYFASRYLTSTLSSSSFHVRRCDSSSGAGTDCAACSFASRRPRNAKLLGTILFHGHHARFECHSRATIFSALLHEQLERLMRGTTTLARFDTHRHLAFIRLLYNADARQCEIRPRLPGAIHATLARDT